MILKSLVASVLYRRPSIETAISALDKSRLKLSRARPDVLFEGFSEACVSLCELPVGPWSSPIADVVMLAKIAGCLQPKRLLEVGSYRGYTTVVLARHTASDVSLVAFDKDPDHGEAYRNTSLAQKIERRVGEVSIEAFTNDAHGSYDLVFLDADHSYEAVKRDTQILLPLLSSAGIFIWHDYSNWGRFSRKNGVPEYLAELAESLPVVGIAGSSLAAYAPLWCEGEGARRLEAATADADPGDPWSTGNLRG